MLKRIVIVVCILVVGLFMVLVVSLLTIPCCALQPSVRLELAVRQADGATQIRLATTIEDLQEMQLFDYKGNMVETIPTAFEKEVNTYYWETLIPAHIHRIELVSSAIPMDLVVEETASDWRVFDHTKTIGFERVLGVFLFSVDAKESESERVRLTTTEDMFVQLDLYDERNQRMNSIDTAFVWDATMNWFVWELTVPLEVTRMTLQPRAPLETAVEVQDLASGWLDSNEGIGFVRGELPVVALMSTTELDDGRIELYFEASEPVFELMHVTDMNGAIEATMPTLFVPDDDSMRGFAWKVIIPGDAYRVVFVPVQSERRRVIASSNVSIWSEITVGNDVGFILLP